MPESEVRQGFLDRGLCGSCGRDPVVVGRARCETCLQKDALYRAELRRDGIEPKASSKDLFLDPSRTRVGILDIESSGLIGDFGVTFCVVIKIFGRDELKVFKMDIRPRDMLASEKKMLNELVHYLRGLDGIVTYHGCVTPGHRVLTDDLRWVPVETLKEGDGLIAFDDNPVDGKRRQWKRATVLYTGLDKRAIIKVTLSDGTTLSATQDHPWLVSTDSGWKWLMSKELKAGMKIRRLLPTWKEDISREGGWLAGFFDSEGNLSQAKRVLGYGDFTFQITATQNPNSVLEEVQRYLSRLGFQFSVRSYDPSNRKIKAVRINGGRSEYLRFLGSVRPNRLLLNFDIEKMGSLKQDHPDETAVVSVEYGMDNVVTLGTSSGTYLVEGFGSHNTGFDLPFIRTRMLAHGLTGYIRKIRHLDLYYTVRGKLLLGRNRLMNVIELLQNSDGTVPDKGRVEPSKWMKVIFSGDQKALEEVVEHCKEDVLALEAALLKLRDITPDRILRK